MKQLNRLKSSEEKSSVVQSRTHTRQFMLSRGVNINHKELCLRSPPPPKHQIRGNNDDCVVEGR